MNNIEILERITVTEFNTSNIYDSVEKVNQAIENIIKENKELKDTYKKLYELCKGKAMQEFINNECDYIPKSKLKEFLEEIRQEKDVATTKILNEDYHLAENGAVCQTLGYVEGRIEMLLED